MYYMVLSVPDPSYYGYGSSTGISVPDPIFELEVDKKVIKICTNVSKLEFLFDINEFHLYILGYVR